MPNDFFKIRATETEEGQGAKVRRLFPGDPLRHYDPFVLLDEFFVEPPAGFPTHPHKGFEGITYMLEGGFHHKDNLGNDAKVGGGGIQSFTAGSGLEHSEMPVEEGVNHGLQLWVNLAKKEKEVDPVYQQIEPGRVPVQISNGVTIRTIASEEGPLQLYNQLNYQDVTFEEEAEWSEKLKQERGFLYVLNGVVEVNGQEVEEAEALFFREGTHLQVHGSPPARFVLIAGVPHHEAIRQFGPYVY